MLIFKDLSSVISIKFLIVQLCLVIDLGLNTEIFFTPESPVMILGAVLLDLSANTVIFLNSTIG